MNNKEILEKNQNASPADEGVVYQDNHARTFGVSIMVTLIAALIVFNLFMGISSYSLQTILWTYIGVEALFKYRYSKNKNFLITSIAGIVAAVAFLLTYIMSIV